MSAARRFARFWWDFVVGDDPALAAGVALALCGSWLLVRADVDAWWLLPLAVAALLALSLLREARAGGRRRT